MQNEVKHLIFEFGVIRGLYDFQSSDYYVYCFFER
jgi:hypothetical protein